MGSRLVSLALALGTAGCATTGEPVERPGPPAFEGVRTLVLARWTDDAEARPKDPLDALKESLVARGYAVRSVDLGTRTPPELRDLERLHARLAARIGSGGPRDRFARRVEPLGRETGEVVAALGVDAVALYHRFNGGPLGGPLPDPLAPAGSLFPATSPIERRPLGALSMVDRAGNALWFEWGTAAVELDPEVPANPAEAIDALVAVLTGEAGEDGGF